MVDEQQHRDAGEYLGLKPTVSDLVEALQDSGTIVDTGSRSGFWLADHLNQFPPGRFLVVPLGEDA